MKTKAVKWYKRVLYHFLDLALVNSFILNKATTSMPLYEFKVDVALALMYGDQFGDPGDIQAVLLRQAAIERAENGDPVAGEVCEAVRLDMVGHFPENVALRGRRCKMPGCDKRSTVWCTKCRVYLCLKKGSTCYELFHTY
jgi:hypothetical protein